MNRKKREPRPRVQGAARQMGLLLDFSAEGMGNNDEDVESDGDLEAELLSLTGGKSAEGEKPRGKAPLPMEHIEKMAALCMKDLDEETLEDDEDLEADEDLLAELGEVLGEDDIPAPSHPTTAQLTATPTGCNGLESTVAERLEMYQTAIANAKQTKESFKVRRYERGLKTLQDMLSSLRSGKNINEEDLPPPVALGKRSDSKEPPFTAQSPAKLEEATPSHQAADTEQSAPVPSRTPPPTLPKPKLSSSPAQLSEPAVERPAPQPSISKAGSEDIDTKATLLSRQREYKLAALQAKQQGDRERATAYYRIAKVMDPILAALEKGESVDMSNLPPPLDQLPEGTKSSAPAGSAPPPAVAARSPAAPASEIPPPPRDVLEALQQRMDKYKAAAAQAKEKGDERKGRMHERIVKQYQEAIRAHKSGKAVDFSELPVPPGFPPIQGMEHSAEQQNIVGVLEHAMKLASQDADEGDEDEESRLHPAPGGAALRSPNSQTPRVSPAGPAPQGTGKTAPKIGTKAQQQLNFLESRKKQLMQAALRAKQKNDIEGAKIFLRQAKGLEPMIEASQNGLPVDITKVPQAPVNEEDFTLVQHRGQSVHPKTAAQYVELMELLRQQHEMCMSYSKQFTHLGNITETSKFEKMAEECKKNMEVVKQAHARGFPLPKYHYEERTISTVKILPDLTNSDMILFVVKGINLPTPPGMTPDDLDAFVRFEFPYPNTEEAQRDKTNVVKNSNCPVFKEQFKLFINRGHRGLKRAIQAKGIKFEIIHKGGLFKQDRVVGTAHLKLEALETNCEIREIIEIMDGRRPTGGKIEVMIRIREPLISQQLDATTEKWLVIDPLSMPAVALPKPQQRPIPMKEVGNRAGFTLQSLNVLAFEKERLERKIHSYKQAQRQPPNELMNQVRDAGQRIQWQRIQLERGGQTVKREYLTQLERYLKLYMEAARRLGQEGNREAAKEALYKHNLVESELQKMLR